MSKDGMAVGSSGVINTGALHVMTPTAAQMTAMQNVLSAGSNDAQKAQLELLRNSPAQIPLNPSGTITVWVRSMLRIRSTCGRRISW